LDKAYSAYQNDVFDVIYVLLLNL